jgi:hypothetical protein
MYIFTLTLTHEQNGRVKAKLNAFQDTTARFWGDPKVKAPETVFVGLAGFGPVAKFQSIDVDRNALRGLTTKEFLAVLDAVSSYPITANPDLRNALMKVLRIEEERRRMNHEAIPPKITLPKMSDPKAGFPTVVLPEDLPGRTGGQR